VIISESECSSKTVAIAGAREEADGVTVVDEGVAYDGGGSYDFSARLSCDCANPSSSPMTANTSTKITNG
jgi:hypothetical protein